MFTGLTVGISIVNVINVVADASTPAKVNVANVVVADGSVVLTVIVPGDVLTIV